MYSLYGANSTINASVTDTSISLQWLPSDLNATYLVQYKVSTDSGVGIENPVTMPADNNSLISHDILGLDPGQTYNIEVEKDGLPLFMDNITTS